MRSFFSFSRSSPSRSQSFTNLFFLTSSYIDILETTLPSERYPTVCLEGTLDISIGGLLSVGGVSPVLATKGLLIDTISSLSIVTGTGELIECSDSQHRDLFRAALGGLGQYGIIVAATLSLSPLPQHEVSVSLYYSAICAFMGDAAHFARESPMRCNGLLGGVYSSSQGTIFTLQLQVFPAETETTITARNRVLEGRQKDFQDYRHQRADFVDIFLFNSPTGIRNFATDLRRQQALQAARRDAPQKEEPPKQLWLALVMPRNGSTQDLLGQWIDTHQLCMFESLSIEVLLRHRYARQSDSLPQPGGTEEELIFLYFTALVNEPAYEEAVRKAYRDLWLAALPLGAVVYPFCTLDRTAEGWRAQHGTQRKELERRKEIYDPDHLFAPAQAVFKKEKKGEERKVC